MTQLLLSLSDVLRLSNFNGPIPEDLLHVNALTGHETTFYALYKNHPTKKGVQLELFYQVGRTAMPVRLGDFYLLSLDTAHHLTISESGKMAALGVPHDHGGTVYTFDFLDHNNRFQMSLESETPYFGSVLYLDRQARTLIVGSRYVSVYEYEGRGEWTHVRDFLATAET